MYAYTIIPEGAKKLIAYASDGDILSDSYVSVELPEGCNYQFTDDANVEFQIISDVHVTTDSGATGEVKYANTHFSQMLEDVKLNSPDSIGIFINGDIANNGFEEEYDNAKALYAEVETELGAELPPLYVNMGNHDGYAGPGITAFVDYANSL